MNDNMGKSLPPFSAVGYRTTAAMLRGTISGQALLNSYNVAQVEREDRVRHKLDELEKLQEAKKCE